jgi:SPOR domain
MTIEQLEKLLIRPEPVGVGPVAPGQLPETFVHKQGKYRQTILGGFAKNWLRIRSTLNVCTGRRARRLLRRAAGFLVTGGVAYLGFLALVDDFRPIDRTRIILSDQQQAITPSNQKRAITAADEQQATISSRSVHDAPPEERSSYTLMSTPSNGAIEPLKNGPLVSPGENAALVSRGENAAVPANDGGYVVQVSAERSDAKAQLSFKTLQSRYPHVLGDRSPLIRRVQLGKKGIFYRAQIGPFDTVEQAKQLCAKLKSVGRHCMVQRNS